MLDAERCQRIGEEYGIERRVESVVLGGDLDPREAHLDGPGPTRPGGVDHQVPGG